MYILTIIIELSTKKVKFLEIIFNVYFFCVVKYDYIKGYVFLATYKE